MTPTAAILAFAAAPHVLPDDVRAAALALLADTLAVGVAGSTAPGADGVFAAARNWGAGDEVPLLARAARLPAPSAAFVNGFQIHALEWDAVHEVAADHALAVVTAALHAVCARAAHWGNPVAPDDALTALCVGVDVACGLGIAATEGPRFARAATSGLIGAALACARVSGIAPARFADVLGVAYSQCAGTMQAHAEGSVALSLQIAVAARAAVNAVDLVAAGLTGPHDALEGPFGYFALFEAGVIDRYSATLDTGWRIAGLSIKPWACDRASHATLGVLAELTAGGLTAARVAAIEARVPPLIHRLVGRPWTDTMTPASARLCLPLLAALMLTEGRIDPRRFEPGSFADPNLRAIGDRVSLVIDTNGDPNALGPQTIRVTTTDGAVTQRVVAAAPGHPANPLPADAAAAKRRFALSLSAGPVAPSVRDDPLAWLAGTA